MSKPREKPIIRVIGADYRVFLPTDVMKAWKITEGDYVRMVVTMETTQIILSPVRS